MKKNISDITLGEIKESIKGLNLSRCSFRDISLKFLSHFLDIDVYQVSFDELKAVYLESCSSIDDIEYFTSEKEIIANLSPTAYSFHKHICKKYFWIEKEPYKKFFEVYDLAVHHIMEINQRIKNIDIELDKVKAENNTSVKQKKEPILNYYRELNEEAKSSIVNFIVQGDIKSYVLKNCYDSSIIPSFSFNVPYHYAFVSQRYNYEKGISELNNKLSDLPLLEFRRVTQMYSDENKQEEFKEWIEKYIKEADVLNEIISLTQTNYILNKHSQVIEETIDIYKLRKDVLVVNLIPSLIEGIFHSICIEEGEDENKLLKEGFQYKLGLLKPILGIELYYEYYVFLFRLLRNKAAHGRLTAVEKEIQADLLLLDLHHACQLANGSSLTLNSKVTALKKIEGDLDDNLLKSTLNYLYVRNEGKPIPEFYQLEEYQKKFNEVVKNEMFWQYVELQLANVPKEKKDTLKKIITNLQKEKELKPIQQFTSQLFKKKLFD